MHLIIDQKVHSIGKFSLVPFHLVQHAKPIGHGAVHRKQLSCVVNLERLANDGPDLSCIFDDVSSVFLEKIRRSKRRRSTCARRRSVSVLNHPKVSNVKLSVCIHVVGVDVEQNKFDFAEFEPRRVVVALAKTQLGLRPSRASIVSYYNIGDALKPRQNIPLV